MSYADSRAVARRAGRDRIQIDGIDVTYLRDYVTPFPRFATTQPFGYGPTSIQFPQVHAGYEAHLFGVPGDLSFARKGARVVISRVFEDGSETIDYRGRVISVEPAGRVLNLDIGGEFSGPTNLLDEQNQMYRSLRDVGRWASLTAAVVGLNFDPWFGPDTGIDLTHVGGQSTLSWAQYVCAMSQDEDGTQRTIMPTPWGSSTYGFPQKDYTTVRGTIYNDDARLVLQVVNDASEQPNAIYGTCIDPEGVRITNAKWPHVFGGEAPDYPMAGGANMPTGTTNGDTINGDGVDILYVQLRELGYIKFTVPNTGVYTPAIAQGVKKLQDDAGLAQTGTMTVAAWKALWNTDVTGYSINGAYIAPLAEDPRVREWNRSENGAILGRNPLYDPNILRVERTIDFGEGITKNAMIRYARGILARSTDLKNWVGTIRMNGMGAFAGQHDGSDYATLTADDMIPYRDIRPGENYWFPYFDGGTLFHVAGCDFDDSGVTLTIDTQARDLIEVREIHARNADSRRDIRREWNMANRSSKRSNGLIASDENFGIRKTSFALKGGQWNKVPVIVGQHGQVNRVHLQVTPDAEYAIGIVSKNISEHDMLHKVGNPLEIADESVWETGDIDKWYRDRTLLLGDGDGKQPCGYGYRRKLNDAGNRSTAPLTGEYLNDENFTYYCAAGTEVLIYLFIWPDRDCTLKRGKLLYCQLDDAA